MTDTDSSATEEHRFPCPACGADMRFDPTSGALQCDHCGHREEAVVENQVTTSAIEELDYEAALRAQLPEAEMEETRVIQCTSCGAQVEFNENDHATECPFCATPIVTDTGTHRHIKPKGLVPFALKEGQARDAMNEWLGKLWFAPGGLQEYARKGRKMQGIYVPYWTYDADTKSRYTGMRGVYYYETQTVMRDGKPEQRRVRKIAWTPVKGRVARWFDDVLVLASRSLPKKYTDGLEPWNLTGLEPYAPHFLAGFRAEGYQVELPEGFEEAKGVMEAQIRRDVRFDIGGDQQKIATLSTDMSDITFKHILLPVWLAAYKYKGKSYRFVVNGQSGKVQGERPWSAWKIAFAVVLGLIVAGAVGYAVAMSQ
ncbi:primosomal protein N' (replication factor Y) - superfamily II helicase [Vannielia litorea]|uniref:TFIIB-type zinc finger domain-containing protein n=1 Tax=Vannielia litorea TaxID=1217970 RepID=UPI001C983D0C|nr:TFIIB-type zinc finger domain-containing protein [Vannielia litorea]MBY6152111.1 primosomal protein N' (replication factor Y) - superfamily II helicase [Vannielia litorea]